MADTLNQYQSALTPQQVDAALTKMAENDIGDFMTQDQADARYVHQTSMSSYVQRSQMLDLVYPVGSVYISANNRSPAYFLGGSWTSITGRFLLAAGSGYTAGNTGGEATHTLTVNEMPSHSHPINGSDNSGSAGHGFAYNSQQSQFTSTGSTGGGQAHNNMPPYLVVYMWKRVS